VIVTADEPAVVPAPTVALYDILELLSVTAALVRDPALTTLARDKNKPPTRIEVIINVKVSLECLNIDSTDIRDARKHP
jgi:hypothetical protein